jgi:hypothetical protein
MILLKPRLGADFQREAADALDRLTRPGTPKLIVRPPNAGDHPNCYSAKVLDLVTVEFDFKERSLVTPVRLQRGAMVAMIRALVDAPLGFVVGYGGTGATASYRSCSLQDELYHRYRAGVGGKAVPAGESIHNRGLAIDAPHTDHGAKALRAHHFHVGEVEGDPSHCTWRMFG